MIPLHPTTLPLAGTHLIEASAGTGKTSTIATLFLRLLLEEALRVDQIVMVTYTEAATAELRDRVRRRLQEAVLACALTPEHLAHDPVLQTVLERSPDRWAARQRLYEALRNFDQAAIFTMHGWVWLFRNDIELNEIGCGSFATT